MRHRRKGAESGQAIVMAVVALGLFMLGVVGLGIDCAQIFAQHEMAQAAADAAAQAAIMSILKGTNSTSTHPFSTASSFTCAVPPTALDLRTPCVYAQDNGFGTKADTVTISFPPTITGVTLAPVSAPAVFVRVQRVLQTGFIRFLGPSTATVYGRASAGILSTVSPNCLYVLDPAAANAFSATSGANVNMNCGIAIDSSNATAASITSGASVTASTISIVGGDSVTSGGRISPAPTTGAPSTADPFASIVGPAAGACLKTNYNPGLGRWTLNPGTYCGGITISAGSTAVFNPGTYIIKGGGVNFTSGSTVTGSDLMFYLTGTNASYRSVSITSGASVTLSAETSGPYLGLLFFQDRSITSGLVATFSSGASAQLTGTLYFATTPLSYTSGSAGSATTAIVADKVSFTSGTRLLYDPTGAKTGLLAKTAGLVE